MIHHIKSSSRSTGNFLTDIILGGQDGLVNILGVILGISAASGDIRLVIAGGLAATLAESISIAAADLTAKIAERDHYMAETDREIRELKRYPEKEALDAREFYSKKGFDGQVLDDIVKHIANNKGLWLNMMTEEEFKLAKVGTKNIYKDSITVGLAALVGSSIPLLPYFFLPATTALYTTLAISAITLFIVGIYKAKVTVGKPLKSGLQMATIGMGAALAGYIIGRLFGTQ